LSKLIAKTTEAKYTLNSPLESDLILLSLVRDRSYQLFIEVQAKMVGEDIEQIRRKTKTQLTKNSSCPDKSEDELFEITCDGSMSQYVNIMYYVSNLPWIRSLSRHDIEALVRSMYFIVFSVFMNKKYIRGEVHDKLPDGTALTTDHFSLRFGEDNARRMFETMEKLSKLTDSETALLTPFQLTNKIGKYI
jgi:hypothetical protein